MVEKQTKSKPAETDFFAVIENFLVKYRKVFLYAAMALCALLGALLFDGRLSFASDDASYIQNALAFIKRDVYPTFQGPLYPFFLAFLIKIFGIRLFLFKSFSIVFLVVQIFLLYKALHGRIPFLFLFGMLYVVALNPYILKYGSSTFTESFYMMIQALSLLVIFRLLEKIEKPGIPFSATIIDWALFGFVFFLLSITKNMSVFAIVAVILYFLFRKEWKYAGLSLIFFGIFRGLYEVVARSIYGNISTSQTEMLLRVDYYDPSKGQVGFGDLISRYFENFGNYISVHMYKMLGLRSGGVPSVFTFEKIQESANPMDPSFILSLIFAACFIVSVYYAFRRNRCAFFILIFLFTLCSVTFAALQTSWNQDRLIVIFLPFLLFALTYGLYELALVKKVGFLKIVVPLFLLFCLLLQGSTSLKYVSKNSKAFKKYRNGDLFYGYPPAVESYVRLSDWAGKNLKKDEVVACNRPLESMVYAGNLNFSRIPKKMLGNADSILHTFKEMKVTHVIVDGMQMGNSSVVLQAIQDQYPDKLTLVGKEGDIEPAYLVKINY